MNKIFPRKRIVAISALILFCALPAVDVFSHASAQTSYTLTINSIGAQDGWILESAEDSNIGGTMNAGAAVLRVGDDHANRQYRSILSFDTAPLPAHYVITNLTLKVRRESAVGVGNLMNILGGWMVDIRRGAFGSADLELADWVISGAHRGNFVLSPSLGWYSIDLTPAKSYVNGNGLTQIRLRFTRGDNNNLLANYWNLHSGNASVANRPKLIVEYYIP